MTEGENGLAYVCIYVVVWAAERGESASSLGGKRAGYVDSGGAETSDSARRVAEPAPQFRARIRLYPSVVALNKRAVLCRSDTGKMRRPESSRGENGAPQIDGAYERNVKSVWSVCPCTCIRTLTSVALVAVPSRRPLKAGDC